MDLTTILFILSLPFVL